MSTLIYAYKAYDNALYIHYPHFTCSVPVKEGVDGKYVVFEDVFAVEEFLKYLDERGLDSDIETHCFEDWEETAIALKDLI